MSVTCYTGVPGSGKSLDAARLIRQRLNGKKPRPVVANFQINTDAVEHPEWFFYVPNDELTTKWLLDFANEWFAEHEFREGSIVLVVDECQVLYNSRNWAKDRDRQTWLTFTSQHRKLGYDVIFIAQSMLMIDNQMRMNVEYEVQHRKVSSVGVVGFIMGALFLGKLFVRVKTYVGLKERIGSEFFIGRKADMELYDTYATFDRQTALQAGN